MEEQIERRRFPRIHPELWTQLSVEEGWPEEAECIDLSGGGALVRGPRPVALGATVELYLRQLGEGRPLRIRAEVVRHVTSPSGTEGGYLMALRFEAPDGTTRLELEELMGIESPPQVAAERRRNSRHEARFLVTFHTERELLHEYTENLSADGMFLRTDEMVEVGREVDVELILPNFHDPIDIRAKVVRRVAPDPQRGRDGGLGVNFIEPDARAMAFVQERVGAYRSAVV